MVWLVVTMALAVANPAAAAQPPSPTMSDACRTAMESDWKGAVAALEATHFQDAKALALKVASACNADEPTHPFIATFLAEIALRTGDPKQAIDVMDIARPSESDNVWMTSEFIYLSAYRALGQDEKFRAERDKLVAANEARMLSGDYWMKQERFETPVAWVDAFRRRTAKGDPNDTFFIATPKTAEMPVSYQINEGGMMGLVMSLGGHPQRDEIGDLNRCGMHESLSPTKPTYAAWRGRAVEVFSDAATFAPEAASQTGADICPGWTFIFPALTPPASD